MRYSVLCFALMASAATTLACSDDDDNRPGADGGSGGTSSGGTPGAGGKSSGGTGGTNATGGASSSGGTKATGGSSNAGGSSSTGGSQDGGTDGSAPDDWAGCPTAEDYDGEASWPHTLTVTEGAVFCSTFDENRTLKEELAAKALMRVAPGQYKLPGADQSGLGLPLCFRFDPASPGTSVTAGDATYTDNVFDGTVSHQYQFKQPVTAFGGARTITTLLIDSAPVGATPAFRLDGEASNWSRQDDMYSFLVCPMGENCYPNFMFDSCTHAEARLHTHVVTFTGNAGAVTFELRIGDSIASTEPGAFVRASGTYKGTSFDQRNYWKLIYNPAHHHFVRNFAVLFDAPIDGACGIQVKGLEPFEDSGTPAEPNVATTVDCALNEGTGVGIQSYVHTAPPLP